MIVKSRQIESVPGGKKSEIPENFSEIAFKIWHSVSLEYRSTLTILS